MVDLPEESNLPRKNKFDFNKINKESAKELERYLKA